MQVLVSLHNHQLYRHVEDPGWRLSWFWAGYEVIFDTTGVEAAEQGNYSFEGAKRGAKGQILLKL